MGDIISISGIRQSEIIDPRMLRNGLIAPAKTNVECEIAPEHSAEPIKSMVDIKRITEYYKSKGKWRDNMLFIVGINFGLRVGDLICLRFSDIINPNFTFKDTFPVFERKTRNTRKKKKNRYITLNRAVREAVTLYLEHTPGVCLSDYMFRNESGSAVEGTHITRQGVDMILKFMARDLRLNMRVSTHTLRKTFAYHQMVMSNNDPRKLLLLSKMLGHSSISITLDYIGITGEEIEEAYRNLNLGSSYNYIDSDFKESEILAV